MSNWWEEVGPKEFDSARDVYGTPVWASNVMAPKCSKDNALLFPIALRWDVDDINLPVLVIYKCVCCGGLSSFWPNPKYLNRCETELKEVLAHEKEWEDELPEV